MTRNCRTLFGLSLIAAIVLSAAITSVASAQANGRLTSIGNVTLKGTEIEGIPNALTAFGLKTLCPGSTYIGHKYNITPHTFIPSGAETITFTPQPK